MKEKLSKWNRSGNGESSGAPQPVFLFGLFWRLGVWVVVVLLGMGVIGWTGSKIYDAAKRLGSEYSNRVNDAVER